MNGKRGGPWEVEVDPIDVVLIGAIVALSIVLLVSMAPILWKGWQAGWEWWRVAVGWWRQVGGDSWNLVGVGRWPFWMWTGIGMGVLMFLVWLRARGEE